MRLIEIIVCAANAAGLAALAAPWRGRGQQWRYLAVIAPLIAVVQFLAEGYRWQMIPAYTLAAIVATCAALLGTGRVFSPATRSVGMSVGILVFVVSAAVPVVVPVFELPRPGGPYAIGTLTYHWRDEARREIFDAGPGTARELMAQVWYPAETVDRADTEPYVVDAAPLSSSVGRMFHVPGFVFDYWDTIPTHATPTAPVATGSSRYPVLVFVSGLGGFRQSNMFQVEQLVSRGFVVVGLDQPYTSAATTFPDGRSVAGWDKGRLDPLVEQSISPVSPAPVLGGVEYPDGILGYLGEDVSFTLTQLQRLNARDPGGVLTQRLDLDHVGAFGVSLGAMVVGQVCRTDVRLAACLMMDAAMPVQVAAQGLRQPSMWLTRDADSMLLERSRSGGWTDRDIEETLTTQRAAFHNSPAGGHYYLQAPGMFHVNFTDAPLWTPLAEAIGICGPVGAERGHDIIAAYTVAFFHRHLADHPSLLLDTAPPWAEVHLDQR
ncbi:carboxylic ester hydrolase [Nocardia sp. NPDC005366]|uniref:alpha/beta hydrolase family protein n=1 Tax=Nocardia sp. NPDC005366 TaxID=3156878 RepID=UPI0033B065F7